MSKTYQQLQELLDQYQIILQADSLTTSDVERLKQFYAVMKRIQSIAIIGLVRDVFANNFDNLKKYAQDRKQLVDEHIKELEKDNVDTDLINYYIEERLRLINLMHQPEAFIGHAVNRLNGEGIKPLIKLFDVDYSNLIINDRIDVGTVRLAIEMLNGILDNYNNLLELDILNNAINSKTQFEGIGISFDSIIALMTIRSIVVNDFNQTIINNKQSLVEQFLCNENNLERSQFEQIIKCLDEMLRKDFLKIKDTLKALFLLGGNKLLDSIPNLKKIYQQFENLPIDMTYLTMHSVLGNIIKNDFPMDLPNLYFTLKRCGAKGEAVLKEYIILYSQEILRNVGLFKEAHSFVSDIDAKVIKYFSREIIKDQKRKSTVESKIPNYIKDANYKLASLIVENGNPMVKSDLQLLLLVDASFNRQLSNPFESIEKYSAVK